MQCPIDKTQLVMAERNGVEIDYCPQCRGVWLDRGELDKIIERSMSVAPPPLERRQEDSGYENRVHPTPYKKKRGGFLEELFDF